MEDPDVKSPYVESPYVVDQDDPQSRMDTSLEPAYVVDHHAERALCRKFEYVFSERFFPVLLAFMSSKSKFCFKELVIRAERCL
jgi:hypothetical protein